MRGQADPALEADRQQKIDRHELCRPRRGRQVVYYTTADSGLGAARDIVTDFTRGTDHLDFSIFSGSSFVGKAAFSAGGSTEIGYVQGSSGFRAVRGSGQFGVQGSSGVCVQADLDGNGTAGMTVCLAGVTGLAASDFIL